MRHLLKQLAEMEGDPFGTVLVIGAGTGSDLKAVRQLNCQRLILMEPHPQYAKELGVLLDSVRNEELWPVAAIGETGTQHKLHVLNRAGESSLQAPQRMTQHLPNLHEIGTIDVQSLTLKEIVETLGIEESIHHRHVLVIDAPGQFHDLISSTPPEALQRFAAILSRSTSVPLYEHDQVMDATAKNLNEVGFDTVAEDPHCVYPHDTRLFVRDCVRVQRQRLLADKVALEARLRRREAAISEKDAEIRSLKERNSSLTDEVAALRVKHGELIQTHAAVVLKDQQKHKLVTELQSQLAETIELKTAAEHLAHERSTELARMKREAGEQLAEFQRKISELETENQNSSADVAAAKDEVRRLDQEYAASARTIGLNAQIQMMRENDLNELQERYSVLLNQRNAQQELLEKLTQRLTAASHYFHQLNTTLVASSVHDTNAERVGHASQSATLAAQPTIDQAPRRPTKRSRSRQPK